MLLNHLPFLFIFFLTACSISNASNQKPDMSVPTIDNHYVEHKAAEVRRTYIPKCIQLCYNHTGSWDCPIKCRNDFGIVIRVMIKALNDNREPDFDAMMESWYGGKN